MIRKASFKLIVLSTLLLCSCFAFAQSGKQKQLEARRVELRREIQKINALVSSNKSKQKSQISLIEDLNYKVAVRRDLIKITNQQANLLTREIRSNQKEIQALTEELNRLKKNYASMIVKSYENKNEQSRVMFLLSASNFKQAYKRIQYINQYTDYQKQQGENIKTKTLVLKQTNDKLALQKKAKDKLISENVLEQKELKKELKQHESIMLSIKKDLSKFRAQVQSKQKEVDKIDREIDKIIRDAIAKSNKKAGKKTTASSGFVMNAEAKALAKDFRGSKGKLPWPVEKGIVKVRYGIQPSPIDPSIKINSRGVRIDTEAGAKVRAVFKGVVLRIIKQKRSNPTVLIKHGNYITAYKNLGKLYVKPGDKVDTKQVIGEVFTNPNTGQTRLRFSIYKDNSTQNPEAWIYRM